RCRGLDPTEPSMITERMTATIKLNTGPAATTELLPHTGARLKVPGTSSSAVSSPSMAQEPPMGKSFREYLVPPLTVLSNLGPIPRENSVTMIPFFFARRKWPSSCIRIIALNIITAITNFNSPPAFNPPVCLLLCCQDLLQIRMRCLFVSFHRLPDDIINIQDINFLMKEFLYR